MEFDTPNIKIVFGENPHHLPIIEKKGVLFEIYQDDFLFRFPNIGTYRVQNGNHITIEPISNAHISEISVFLFGSVMGALFHQRGSLPLHGSSIVIGDSAISVIGNSSVGKSSLAAGFAISGYKILSDDITVLSDGYNDEFMVQPGLPHLKLWEDVLKYMNTEGSLRKVRPTINKYIHPLNHSFHSNPVPLKTIICLDINNSNTFTSELITGSEKFNVIKNHIYRNQYIYGRKKVLNHFKQLSKISDQMILYQIKRPERPLLVFELVEYIRNQVLEF